MKKKIGIFFITILSLICLCSVSFAKALPDKTYDTATYADFLDVFENQFNLFDNENSSVEDYNYLYFEALNNDGINIKKAIFFPKNMYDYYKNCYFSSSDHWLYFNNNMNPDFYIYVVYIDDSSNTFSYSATYVKPKGYNDYKVSIPTANTSNPFSSFYSDFRVYEQLSSGNVVADNVSLTSFFHPSPENPENQVGNLAEIVQKVENKDKVLQEIVGLLPVILLVIIGLIALRKALQMLVTFLRRS